MTRTRREELERLGDEVVPVLLSRLADSGLAELEVRGGDWRVRVRRAWGAGETRTGAGGRGRDRGSRSSGGKASVVVSRDAQPTGAGQLGTASANGEVRGTPSGSGDPERRGDPDTARVVVRAPAVGYFVPSDALGTGQIVGRDERLGHIDVLGVRQDVVSSRQGIVSRLFVEPGQAVEYGQELLQIDAVHRSDDPARRGAARAGAEAG